MCRPHRLSRLRDGNGRRRIGIYGFGAAAHLIAQIAIAEGRRVFAFTRPGDEPAQAFARKLGAAWAGGSDEPPPAPLDAALLFAPVGALVPAALAATRPGGTVVCAGIHMSDIPAFPYRLLWQERVVRSVANLTRADGEAFLACAARIPLAVHTRGYALADANIALADLRDGRLEGAAVLTPAARSGVESRLSHFSPAVPTREGSTDGTQSRPPAAAKSAKPKRRPAVRRKPAAAATPSAVSTAAMKKTLADMSRMANLMTPEQAIELYKANARMALDVINTAIDNTAKLRKLQFEGEQSAREFGRSAARSAAEVRDPQALMSMSAEAGQEALERSLAYWGEMFDLIVEMQKRLFALIEEQARGHAWRQAGEGGDADDARPGPDAERRRGDAAHGRLRARGLRLDAEADGRHGAHGAVIDAGHEALRARGGASAAPPLVAGPTAGPAATSGRGRS